MNMSPEEKSKWSHYANASYMPSSAEKRLDLLEERLEHARKNSREVTTQSPYDVRAGDIYGGDYTTSTTGLKEIAELERQIAQLKPIVEAQAEERRRERNRLQKELNPEVKDPRLLAAFEKAKERFNDRSAFRKLITNLKGLGPNKIDLNDTTVWDLNYMYEDEKGYGR